LSTIEHIDTQLKDKMTKLLCKCSFIYSVGETLPR